MVRSIFAHSKKTKLVIGVTGAMLAALFLLFGTQHLSASADSCTWTGAGADTNITTAGNWTGCDNGNVPEDGDTVVFPAGPTNKTVTIDVVKFFDSVTFSGSGYTVDTTSLGNNQLFIYSDLTISGNNNTFNSIVRLLPTTTASFTHSGTGSSFAQYFTVEPMAVGTDVTFDIQSDLTLPMIAQTVPDAGRSVDTFTKDGSGTLNLSGTPISGIVANTGIYIKEGTWKCNAVYCLGDNANEIILDEGGDIGASSLEFNYDGTVSNPITINAATGDKSSIKASGNLTFEGAITAHDNLHFFVNGDHSATVSSNVSIDGTKMLTVYGDTGYQTNTAIFNGNIYGTSGARLTVDDAHVTLAGSNTYTGVTELHSTGGGALVTVKDNNSLGNASAGTIVNSGTTLNFDNVGSVFYDEPITVSGTGVGGSYPGALVKDNDYVGIYGGITLTGNTTLHNETAQIFVIGSVISGNYDITMTANDDTGGFAMQPGGNNTFHNLTATGTQLALNGSSHTVIPGNLTVNAVEGKLSWIWLNSNNMFADNSVIALNNDGSQEAMIFNTGVVDIIGTITGDGSLEMQSAAAHFRLSGGPATFSGRVDGYTDSMIETIGGSWTFAGRNADIGNGFTSYYVNGGKFIANAADTSLSMSPFSMSDGVLAGTDLIGRLSAYGGTVAPGNSPGCLYPAGDVAFTADASYLNIEINGTTACSGYDVLNASGEVALNNAVLNLSILNGYSSTYGNKFTVVQGNSVGGTFRDLSDGDVITSGDMQFRINYTQNSVTLTDITPEKTSLVSTLAETGGPVAAFLAAATALILVGIYTYRRRRTLHN